LLISMQVDENETIETIETIEDTTAEEFSSFPALEDLNGMRTADRLHG
jgi:hypothetical protein